MIEKMDIVSGKIVPTKREDAPIWVTTNPDDVEKRSLVDDLKIDEHTLACSLDPDEPARLEMEPEHLAVIFKHPKNYSERDQFLFKIASMGLFLFKNRLVVVLSENVPIFTGKAFNTVESPQDVFLKIIYRSIFHFLEHLRIINMISDEIERKISVSMENKNLLNLFSLEKSLVYYLNAINSNDFVFGKLKVLASRNEWATKQLEFLDDIVIENGQCYRQAEIYSNILASLMDARVSIVSNNLNILMKNLNFITIGIMVPTFVVSAFSMNVKIPIIETHPHAFWIIVCLALLSVAVVMLWWRYFSSQLERKNR